MPRFSSLVLALLATPALALQLAPLRAPLQAMRAPIVRLEETELSDEQIAQAAEKASEPAEAWPAQKPTFGVVPNTNEDDPKEFDPRIILYVSLPALVLIGQLFFTFSRDALGDVALGPAIMD